MKHKGVSCDSLVESLDLFPTLIDLAKPSFTRIQHSLDGKSLAGIFTNQKATVRDAALSYWRDGITARTRTHRLIVTSKDGQLKNVELYDESTNFDPVINKASMKPDMVNKLKAYLPN